MSDKELGMDRPISRRDFVNGTAVALGALGTPDLVRAAAKAKTMPGGGPITDYPPAKTGMRGSHDGAFESAHALRDGTLDIKAAFDTGETYDCVIVGGGMSGLSAAHFFLKNVGSDARVLVIDNHDDFGGHAKRNEFTVDGKLLVLNGGTMNIESPQRYNEWATSVLTDIGVDLHRYEAANVDNDKLYSSMNLGRGYFFDKATFGKDQFLRTSSAGGRGRGGMGPDFVAQSPLSAKAKADLLRLIAPEQPDYLASMSTDEKKAFLAKTSLADYYLKVIKVDPQVLWFYQHFGEGSFCVGADANPAIFGWVQNMPGFSGLKLGPIPTGLFENLPGGQHGKQIESGKRVHFPDGNATLARLLVAKLVPDAINGRTQEDMGTAIVDYGKLDVANKPARIRLNSTVLNVKHDGDPAKATEAVVTYATKGRLQSVRAKRVVMACWNMFIPYLIPDMPKAQKEALAYGVKGPLVYTSIALRNWTSFEKLGVSNIEAPGSFQPSVALTEACGIGGLSFAKTAKDPISLHLTKAMTVPGLPKRDQHRAGRANLLALSFADFERETRSQLGAMLSGGGFDPARDIAGITVNRWPHGYAYTYNSLWDPMEWCYSESNERPCVKARQPWGLITIANSDAAASPHTDAAFLEAHRAVSEAIEGRTFPFARQL